MRNYQMHESLYQKRVNGSNLSKAILPRPGFPGYRKFPHDGFRLKRHGSAMPWPSFRLASSVGRRARAVEASEVPTLGAVHCRVGPQG